MVSLSEELKEFVSAYPDGYTVEPTLQRLLDIMQAEKVAKRLLGIPKFKGLHHSIRASSDLEAGDLIVFDTINDVRKWDGIGQPQGISLGKIPKGTHGWVQVRSQ